jgi:general secretion pathway protein D
VAGPVSADFVELITNQREIETTVLADDGEIIVLGGLIETDEQIAESGVPGLGGLPGVGRLFRNESRSQTRRNLMVFIRPTIVRDAEDMRELTRRAMTMRSASSAGHWRDAPAWKRRDPDDERRRAVLVAAAASGRGG